MFNFSFPKNTIFSNPSNNFDVVNSSVDIITSNIHPCKYHNSFIYPQNKPNTTKIFFSLIHFNIRSLQKNFDSLHEFLSLQQSSPDIICLSETRLKEQPLININIPGYSFIHTDSPTCPVPGSIFQQPFTFLDFPGWTAVVSGYTVSLFFSIHHLIVFTSILAFIQIQSYFPYSNRIEVKSQYNNAH